MAMLLLLLSTGGGIIGSRRSVVGCELRGLADSMVTLFASSAGGRAISDHNSRTRVVTGESSLCSIIAPVSNSDGSIITVCVAKGGIRVEKRWWNTSSSLLLAMLEGC